MSNVYLQAPHQLIQATVMLPSEKFGDSISPNPDVKISNSMNGKIYSYVSSTDSIRISWDLIVTEEKSIELEEFVKTYRSYDWRVIDPDERVYVVKFVGFPLEFRTIEQTEAKSVRLEMEGKQIV